jgi:hypothetical protein
MPGLDKTGPGGQGPKTGRGLGRGNPDFDEKSLDKSAGNVSLSHRLRRGFGRNTGRFFGRGRKNRGRGAQYD